MKNINKKMVWIILCMLLFTALLPIAGASKKNNIENYGNITVNLKHLNYNLDGNILYVGGSGLGNYTKIQNAIDNTSDGDMVFVFDDSSPYYEHIIINKSINLKGENKDTTVIDGNGTGDIIFIEADWINISGFTIQNDGGDWGNSGVDLRTKYCIIRGNKITNNFDGIYLRGACNNIIIDNDISSNEHYGVYIFQDNSDNIIQNNIFSENIGVLLLRSNSGNSFIGNIFSNNEYGLTLYGGGNTVLSNSFFNDGLSIESVNNIVDNNTVNGKPLVYLEEESNKIIEDNVGQIILINCRDIIVENQNIQDTTEAITLGYTNNCKILNNEFSNNFYGIYSFCSDNNFISNNRVESNIIFGIYLSDCNYNTISSNICNENNLGEYHYYGIYLSGSSNNTIKNNICSKNGVGIACKSYSNDNIIEDNIVNDNIYIGIKLEFQSNNNIISKNNITRNPWGVILNEVAFNTIIENNFMNNENDIRLKIVYRFLFKLFKSLSINGNYWGRARIFPKIMFAEYIFVYMDAPFGGSIGFHWIYIDWNPAQEPYDI